MPIIQEKKKKIDSINEEIKVKKETLIAVQNEEEVIIKEKQFLEGQINELKDKIDVMCLEIDQLQRKVVRSPERIMDVFLFIKEKIENFRA